MSKRGYHEAGAALVTALVIAALTTAAAVAMASRTQLEIGRTTYQIEATRRHALVARVEAEIRAGLRDDVQTGRVDAAGDRWDERDYFVRFDDTEAHAIVRDAQRRFNLNNLVVAPRTAGGRGRSAATARNATTAAVTDSGTSIEAPGSGAAPSKRPGSARPARNGSRRPSAPAVNVPSTAAGSQSGSAVSQPAGPEFVEKTRFVLDPAVAELVAGRGRPSDLAALVAQGGMPRVAETYLEQVEPAPSGETADVNLRDVPAAASAADPVNVPAAAVTGIAAPSAAGPAPVAPPHPAPLSPAVENSAAGALPVPADGAARVSMPPNELWVARFSLLLSRLDITEPVLQAILDWLDADAEVRFPNGAEDAYYLKLDTPYRAANRPFTDVSELLLVRGVTPDVYARLLPFVTVLPYHTDVNINAAPAEVLMSLAPEIDRRAADMIIAARNVQAFRSTASMLALPMLAMTSIDPVGIGVDSEFFEATTIVTSGTIVEHSRVVIGRARSGRSRIVSRHNGYFND